MLLPFFEKKTILQIIVERLLTHFPFNKIYLLTTISDKDDDLVKSISHYPIEIFRGDEFNVLNRFLAAGNHFNVEHIVRICADNPFLDVNFLTRLLEAEMDNNDYLSYSVLGRPVIKCHYGLFAERTKISSLNKIMGYTTDCYYYEHVTNFMYEHPQLFKCKLLEIADEISFLNDTRLTVDTITDFNNAQFIFRRLKDSTLFTAREIAKIVNKNPELKISMTREIQYNSK
jgi:spore coat polysaccharide biosynthesis protein SpsF